MITQCRAPLLLKLIAYSLMIEGFLWLAVMTVQVMFNTFQPNPFAIVALIGWGLIRMEPSCYRWAVVSAVFFLLLLSVIVGVILLTTPFYGLRPLSLEWKKQMLLSVCGVLCLLKIWQLKVLVSLPIHRLFYPPEGT